MQYLDFSFKFTYASFQSKLVGDVALPASTKSRFVQQKVENHCNKRSETAI